MERKEKSQNLKETTTYRSYSIVVQWFDAQLPKASTPSTGVQITDAK